MLTSLSIEQLKQVAAIIVDETRTDPQRERDVVALVGDRLLARRAIDWIPEAFGMVLVDLIGGIVPPSTFSARDLAGAWQLIPLADEPVFGQAVDLAKAVYRDGPRDLFSALALRSATGRCVNNTLNAQASIEGATLSGPAMIGIPAETYLGQKS